MLCQVLKTLRGVRCCLAPKEHPPFPASLSGVSSAPSLYYCEGRKAWDTSSQKSTPRTLSSTLTVSGDTCSAPRVLVKWKCHTISWPGKNTRHPAHTGSDLFRSQISGRFSVRGRMLKLHCNKFELICSPSDQRGHCSEPLRDASHCFPGKF